MNDFQTLLFTRENGVARITLNRPDAANSIDQAMGEELHRAILLCEQDPAIRALLITGAGGFFSAGGDLKAFTAFGEHISGGIHEITSHLHAAILRLANMRLPVVMAVNGMAAGAGFSLAMAGDLVLASEKARFTMAYTGVGLSPDGGASYFLPRLIGLRRVQELMLTNRRLTAHEALDWGLVTRVCPDESLDAMALELAKQLAAGPTRAFGAVKHLLSGCFDNSLESQLAHECDAIARLAASPDGQEGIQAFLTKRPPAFQGK